MPAFAVMGGLTKCMFGVAPGPLMILPTARVMAGGKPVGTIMDFTPTNLVTFGMCTSPTNPSVAAAMGAPMPCKPIMPAPWMIGNVRVLIGNKPVMNMPSKVLCTWAGLITITFPGQIQVQD